MNLLACIAMVLSANVYNETFDSAVKAYNSGDFHAAIENYEQLISEGVASPAVFYNLANAYYRNHQAGPAIANYERALQLTPGLENARENLDKAVRETPHHLARPLPPDWEQSVLFWHYNLSRSTTYFLAGAAWLIFWGLLALRQWRPLRYTRTAVIVTGVLAVAFGVSAWEKAHPVLLAVAASEKVPVHYGQDENETVRFELAAGDRVTVDRRENHWARVTTADGERGWTKASDLVLVGPPYAREESAHADAGPPK